MPSSQLAACIYTTNGAPVAFPAPARARTHTTPPLISTRRHKVAEMKKRERRRGQPLCWSGTRWQEQHEHPHLYCWMIQRRSYKLMCFGKFTAALAKKVICKRKSQLKARTITEMIKVNAKALENILFLLQIESCFFFFFWLFLFFWEFEEVWRYSQREPAFSLMSWHHFRLPFYDPLHQSPTPPPPPKITMYNNRKAQSDSCHH